ncbi:MAG: WbqC family protein [Flavobacteriales bacterium]|nr:WbqC family protein [Flavobacteriaceae bacterium]MDO7582292.1 WbqC family protein [Flavobacteriaceae bacterium]MDO7592405.1 WbqC family protein [Flavobacteriaceae bacterium]MDO7598437.1 WbqC family protein [Flavobacteriaceae bacterium]MDO7603365.1 WbqC family protein [Flavobacteriaceae bacterium]
MQLEIFSSYIPNIATLAILAQQKNVIVQTGAQYQKQTFRNRTIIAGANGVLNLSIPIEHGSKYKKLIDKEVKIAYEENWQQNHWKSFVSAYSSSPFFEFYQDDLKPIFFKKHEKLVDYNMSLLTLILEWLEIETKITTRSKQDAYNPFSDALVSSKAKLPLNFPKYIQVFEAKLGFHPNLNALDLLSNLGPESSVYLRDIDLNPMLELS